MSCYGNNALTNINDEMILIGGNDISVLSLKSFNLINKINIGFKCWIILPLEYNLLIGGKDWLKNCIVTAFFFPIISLTVIGIIRILMI